jgi:hypothetical protein
MFLFVLSLSPGVDVRVRLIWAGVTGGGDPFRFSPNTVGVMSVSTNCQIEQTEPG